MSALDLAIQRAAEIVASGAVSPDPDDRTYPCVCSCPKELHGGARHAGKCANTDTCGCSGRYRFNRAWELAYEAVDGQNREWTDEMAEWNRRERAEWLAEHPKAPGSVSVGASDIGACRAKIGFRERPPADFYRSPEDTRDAEMGSIIHAEVTARWKDLYPWRIIEQAFQMPGFDRTWRPDSFDPITGEIEDLKSAGDWKWDLVSDQGPDEDTWDQGFLYGLLLSVNGYNVRTIRITYAWRHKGHSWSFVAPYDEERAKDALDRLLSIATELDFLPENGMLPRDRPGPTTDGLCRRCLAYETEVITDRGVRQIGDIVGERVHILDGNGGWIEAEAKPFGVQPLMRLTLQRRGITKVIHATPDHGWFVVDRPAPVVTACPVCNATEGKNGPFQTSRAVRAHMARNHTAAPRLPERTRVRVETQDLMPGDRLTSVRAKSTPRKGQHPIIPAPVGIQHGFVYGDGWASNRRNGGSYAAFHGAKDASVLERWFPNHTPATRTDGARTVANLPRFFKSAPPMGESSSYLYGFLAGYFAADGCVDERGRCTMASASRESIDLIRDIAFRLGLDVGPVRGQWRRGISGSALAAEETYLYSLTLNSRTLTADFFLNDAHRERWQAAGMEENEADGALRWQVVSVEATDRVEETYCFEVPTTHSFVLADNLLTSNCFARDYCWNLRTAEEIGRSGESLTHLGLFPEETELAWAGQRAIEARDTRLAAEKVEAEAMALIDGVQPGEYGEIGEVVIEEKETGGAPNYKGYVEKVQDWKHLPESDRPPIEEITLTRFNKKRKTSVKRLAKAERLKREKALAKAKTEEAVAAAAAEERAEEIA